MNKTIANSPAATFNPNRIVKGVKGGGEFTFGTKPESQEVTLGLDNDAILANREEMAELLKGHLSPEAMLAHSYQAAAYAHNRYNTQNKTNTHSVSDSAQDAIVGYLEAVMRGNEIANQKQLLGSIALNETVRRATSTVFRAEDRRAYRQWDELKSTQEATEGRRLTQREQDELAKQVLANWADRRHMPSKEFRKAITVDLSLDKTLGSDGSDSTLGSLLVSPEATVNDIEPDSYMDRAFTALETKGAKHKAEAKRLAYNAFAERAQTPLAAASSLSQRQVTNHRKVMTELDGGVTGACADWSNGTENKAVEALFAPFGELDESEQEKVVTLFEHFGEDKAQTMWESAISFANNKHSSDAGNEAVAA